MFSAWEEGDLERSLAYVSADAEWLPSVWSGGGSFHGHDGVRRWAARLAGSDRRVEVRALEYRDGPSGVAVIGEVRRVSGAGEPGAPITLGWVFEVEDGLVVRGEGFTDPGHALRLAGVWRPPP